MTNLESPNPPRATGGGAIQLQNGIFRPGSVLFGGEFSLGHILGWTEQHVVLCRLELAQQLDAALTHAAKAGPIDLPNHVNARRLLIESGSRFALGNAEARFNEAYPQAVASVYQYKATGARRWVPVVLATNRFLAARAGLLLEGNDTGGVSWAPQAGPLRFALALTFGTKPQVKWNSLHLSADEETEYECEVFPEELLNSGNVLARRIVSEDERASWAEIGTDHIEDQEATGAHTVAEVA